MVVEYTGLNIREIGEMEMDEYLYYFRDAFIHSMNQTKEGREYLENAFYFKQEKPDRARLQEKFGNKGKK